MRIMYTMSLSFLVYLTASANAQESLMKISFIHNEHKIAGSLTVYGRNFPPKQHIIDSTGTIYLNIDCNDINKISFTPENRMLYNNYEITNTQEPRLDCENKEITVSIRRQNWVAEIEEVDLSIFSSDSREFAARQNMIKLMEQLEVGSIPNFAYYSNELAEIFRRENKTNIEVLFSEYAIIAGSRVLLHKNDSDILFSFDKNQNRIVTTLEGVDALKRFQSENNLQVTGKWDPNTFTIIREFENPSSIEYFSMEESEYFIQDNEFFPKNPLGRTLRNESPS